jgi:hypothetical protein
MKERKRERRVHSNWCLVYEFVWLGFVGGRWIDGWVRGDVGDLMCIILENKREMDE